MMRTLFLAFTISLMFHTSLSQAADPNTSKQIQQLQRQVSALQQELRTVRALINVAKDGTTFIHAKQHKQEVTGGNEVSRVSADQRTEVGRSQTETIGINQSLTVGTNQSSRVGKDMTLTVGRNLAENVAINRTMAAGKQMIMTAGDRLTLQSGKSSIVLNKNGDIDIKGKNIFIKGSGPVTIKGSKVTTN
jgi:type VI secretion system secreted protein VgrG